MPFFDKGTNNRNNGNPKIMVDGGMYDPLLPSNEYGVNSKSSSPVRTPSRRDSGLGKEVYDDYDMRMLSHHHAAAEATIVHTSLGVNILQSTIHILYEIGLHKIRKLDMIHLSQ